MTLIKECENKATLSAKSLRFCGSEVVLHHRARGVRGSHPPDTVVAQHKSDNRANRPLPRENAGEATNRFA